ncbi:MAG: HAMP domain-containing protein [Bryobacterales bacterium]|nr:HAMP domain-containing protein [Bryobacterales bacterium]
MIIRRFRNIPIRQKLLIIIFVTTAVTLLTSMVGIVVVDSVLFQGHLQRDLQTFARVIADNSSAAVLFNDSHAAGEILATLQAKRHISAACLYRANGSILARYVRPGQKADCPPPAGGREVASENGTLTASHPIVINNRRIGTLVLRYDLGELTERVRIYGLTVVLVLMIAGLLGLAFSSRLCAAFAAPIVELAGTAALVSHTRDYSARASLRSNDEVGSLVTAFNEMLAGIQSRDTELTGSLADRDEALANRERLNQELKRINENLTRSNEDLERFAFIASHDLQEPLRMITLYSQLLVKKYGSMDEQSATYVDCIVSGTRRMRELLEDLLVYAEIAARSEQELSPVDLNQVLAKAKANLQASIELTSAVISASVLPTVAAYDGHLVSLFQNLIGNSIKYRGSQAPRISITVKPDNGMYQFAFADNGVGIAPEYHARIFQAFKRLHGKDIPGTGIGLAICQRVVERYGGRIWVESEPGHGATFLFTIPRPNGDEQPA